MYLLVSLYPIGAVEMKTYEITEEIVKSMETLINGYVAIKLSLVGNGKEEMYVECDKACKTIAEWLRDNTTL